MCDATLQARIFRAKKSTFADNSKISKKLNGFAKTVDL
jgi:hypothetical protein